MKTALLLLVTLAPLPALAAIGCTLSNPAADLKYVFPEMTSYREELETFSALEHGQAIFASMPQRVGSALDPLYETYETPYTVYLVFSGDTKLGVVHGVNVAGVGGVIQVFLSTAPDTGVIRGLFFQRVESPSSATLRSKPFRAQFEGLTAADFYKHDYYQSLTAPSATDRVAPLMKTDDPDVRAALRGIRKNLVLLDLFVYGRRFEPFFAKAQQALGAQKRQGKP